MRKQLQKLAEEFPTLYFCIETVCEPININCERVAISMYDVVTVQYKHRIICALNTLTYSETQIVDMLTVNAQMFIENSGDRGKMFPPLKTATVT